MLFEQCRPLHGGRLVRVAFVGCAPFWAPIATQRLPERWNDVSGGWPRTGPAFCDPAGAPIAPFGSQLFTRPPLRLTYLFRADSVLREALS